MIKNIFSSIAFLFLFVFMVNGQSQSIKNGKSWYDTDGKMIQAHGASIIKHDGLFYMVGEDRTDQWVFTAVNLYVSSDLINWEFKNTILDRNTNVHLSERTRIVERPCLMYNPKMNRFVLWVKYQNGSYTNNKAAVFLCNTIDGKYIYYKEFEPDGYDSNDGSLFQDTDGSVYYISTCKEFKSLNIYKLSPDFLDVESSAILFKNQSREAPVIMKKGELYYLLSSAKTGWDPNALKFSTSKSLMSGWSNWTTIADKLSYDSQPTHYLQIMGSQDTSFFYIGDRWKDPGLPESKTVIYPMSLKNGSIDIDYVYEFKIDLDKGTWTPVDDNVYLDQSRWSVVSSTGAIDGARSASKAIDNNPNTFWQTAGSTVHPHEIVIDLGASQEISGFKYLQRNDDQIYGIVKEYKLYLSEDPNNWGAPVSQGWMSYTSEKNFMITSARYMRFVADSEHNRWGTTKYTSAAELKLIQSESSNSLEKNELFKRNDVQLCVYPNPSNSSFTVVTKGIKKPVVCIYDSMGRVVLQRNIEDSVLELHKGSDFKNGVYLIKIMSSGCEVCNTKIIIK